MSRTFKDGPQRKQNRSGSGRGRQRHISVRAIRRDPPDLRKLSRALIDLALAEAEAEAQRAATQPDQASEAAPADQERHD